MNCSSITPPMLEKSTDIETSLILDHHLVSEKPRLSVLKSDFEKSEELWAEFSETTQISWNSVNRIRLVW